MNNGEDSTFRGLSKRPARSLILLTVVFLVSCKEASTSNEPLPPYSVSWKQTLSIEFGFVECLAANDGNIYAGTYGRGVFRSSNNGNGWTAVNDSFPGPLFIFSLLAFDGNVFANASEPTGRPPFGGVFVTTDNGVSWSNSSTGLSRNPRFNMLTVWNNEIVAWTSGGNFVSRDTGASWIPWIPFDSFPYNSSITSIVSQDSTIFVSTRGNGVFRSTNNGTYWASVNTRLPSRFVRGLAFLGSRILAFVEEGNGVFLSTSNGDMWQEMNNGLTAKNVRSMLFFDGVIFIATYGGGVFFFDDDKAKWTSVNSGLTNLNTHPLIMSNGFFFVGTEASVFKGAIQRR